MPLRAQIQKRVNRKFLLFCLVLVITVTLIFTLRWANRNQLLTLGNSDAYTELYFTKPNQLPSTLLPGKPSQVPVTLVNHEGSPKSYDYQVTVYENGERTAVAKKQLKLADGQKQILFIPVDVTSDNHKVLIIITLLNTNQRIQFYAKS
jgi:hypothetical protein